MKQNWWIFMIIPFIIVIPLSIYFIAANVFNQKQVYTKYGKVRDISYLKI